MKKLKKTLVVLILCNIMLLLTAMTCNDSYEYRSVIFENQSNDTIITWSSGWKPTTPEAVIEYYSDEWATQIPPHEHSVESWVDEEDIMVYIFVIKKADRDLYFQKEIVEKGLAEYYSYSYQDLKKMDFKIVYSGENPSDSIHTVSM